MSGILLTFQFNKNFKWQSEECLSCEFWSDRKTNESFCEAGSCPRTPICKTNLFNNWNALLKEEMFSYNDNQWPLFRLCANIWRSLAFLQNLCHHYSRPWPRFWLCATCIVTFGKRSIRCWRKIRGTILQKEMKSMYHNFHEAATALLCLLWILCDGLCGSPTW